MNLLELNYQRRKARAAANVLLDAATTEGRALTVVEQVRFDCLIARISEIDHDIQERESLRKLAE